MNTRVFKALLFLGAVLLVPACNDNDHESGTPTEPESPQALLAACGADGSLDLFSVLGGIPDLLGSTAVPAPGVVLLPTRPNSFTYHVPVDLDGDGVKDDAIDGEVAFTGDPRLGFAAGDTAGLSWALVGDDAQGNGILDLRFLSAEAVEVTGNGAITRGGCTMTFDTDGQPIVVSLQVASAAPSAPAQPVAGTVRVVVVAGDRTLAGTLGMEAGSSDVLVQDVDVNGLAYADFSLDLHPVR